MELGIWHVGPKIRILRKKNALKMDSKAWASESVREIGGGNREKRQGKDFGPIGGILKSAWENPSLAGGP